MLASQGRLPGVTATAVVGLLLLASPLVRAAASSPENPTTPAISFYWSTKNDSDLSLPQCEPFLITTTDNPGSSVQSVSPFFFTSAAVGYVPTVQYVGTALGGSFNWTPTYPVGTAVNLAMTDSGNNSGGSISGYTVVAGSTSCATPNVTSPISFTVNPGNEPCDEIDITISGGKKPYTVSVINGASGRYANLTGQSNNVKFGNTVPAGQQFYLFVTDSTGTASPVSGGMTSQLNSVTCNQPVKSSSVSLGAVIGGVVGGVLGALLIAIIAYFYFRRKKARAVEEQYQQELNQPDVYRQSDGTAPLVTPFLVPHSSSDDYSRLQASSNENGGSYTDSNYPATTPTSTSSGGYPTHHNPSPPPPLPQPTYDHTGVPYPGHEQGYSNATYSSADSSKPGLEETDPWTGLAHPEAFNYRVGPGYAQPPRRYE
ncbi:hypothetical protein MNV49_007934 [Pseudohyphozyma bogoriensis]|nr:hypothetical protein MNV49_007934 [Pseudohyphozyma bogoriensis]